MSDIHSDDLESWAEVEGKSEKQWPPREIMDGLVDEMKRVVVIAVNCGFLGEWHACIYLAWRCDVKCVMR